MYAMPADFGCRYGCALLPSFVVDTNESLRQRALRLVTHGVSQKVLAGKMGMTPSTFSRWLNQKDGINPASVAALDGFNAYVHELNTALTDSADRGSGQAPHDEHTPPAVPGASRATERDPVVGRVARMLLDEAKAVAQSSRPTRSTRQPTAAARRPAAGGRPADRKRRR
jgi:transcriptional regulator with XRE-family HTH domain